MQKQPSCATPKGQGGKDVKSKVVAKKVDQYIVVLGSIEI